MNNDAGAVLSIDTNHASQVGQTRWATLVTQGAEVAAFDRSEWVESAARGADFVLDHMLDPDGGLLRIWTGSRAKIPAFLDDHVFMTSAMLELYDATFDPAYLERALMLQQQTHELFWDKDRGGFYFAAADNEELLVRQKEVYDGAIPSGNSVAAIVLTELE